jgi:hypothetical protein
LKLTPFNFAKWHKECIEKTIIFVYDHLNKWRDNSNWSNKESEKKLNADLVKKMSGYARSEEFPANFFHEELQGKRHSVDIVACHFSKSFENYSDAVTVFECKRLTTDIGKERVDEYVTGHEKTGGGIQRFKLEVHGKEHEIVGMIGYVQTGTCPEWLNTINTCIDGLCGKPDENSLSWTRDERINTVEHDDKNGKYYGKSLHQRKTKPNITIHHLWVNMQEQNIV